MDAKVLKSIRRVFLLQSREGALEDTLNDDIDVERAKAGLAELQSARGQASPVYERFVEKLRASSETLDAE